MNLILSIFIYPTFSRFGQYEMVRIYIQVYKLRWNIYHQWLIFASEDQGFLLWPTSQSKEKLILELLICNWLKMLRNAKERVHGM